MLVALPAPVVTPPGPACLNCGAALAGEYCAACGQQAVDLAAPTWRVLREAMMEATDLDGRVPRTLRGLATPGHLTAEYLQGRRAPYVGPLKLFLLAGTVLTTTWVLTRGVDARFYGFAPDASAGAYIDTVVRGSMGAGLAIAIGGWLLGRRRRRLLDEAVFALHVVAALSAWTAAVVWVSTAWKVLWGTAANAPGGVSALLYMLFVPAWVAGVAYLSIALRRVHGGAWWAAWLRAFVLAVLGVAAVTGSILAR